MPNTSYFDTLNEISPGPYIELSRVKIKYGSSKVALDLLNKKLGESENA